MDYPPPPPPPPAPKCTECGMGQADLEPPLVMTFDASGRCQACVFLGKQELATHQQKCIDWGVKHGHYPPPPPPPPPAAIAIPPPPAPIPAPQPLPGMALPIQKPGPKINVRAKGQRGEREVVKLLQAVVDVVRRRKSLPPIVLQRNTLQAHLGGEDLMGLDGFAVEVKFQENENVPAWWRQAISQAVKRSQVTGQPHVPILFWRASRSKWSVRFRAYVNTPGDRDQIEMDLETSVEEFIEWFGNAYDEKLS